MSHYDRQYKLQRHMLSRVRDMIWWVEYKQVSHKEYLDMVSKMVWQRPEYKKLTRYNQAYIEGYIARWQEGMKRSMHEWRVYLPGVGHVNSQTPEGNKVLQGNWSKCVSDLGASFWKGTNKVWFGEPAVFEMYKDE